METNNKYKELLSLFEKDIDLFNVTDKINYNTIINEFHINYLDAPTYESKKDISKFYLLKLCQILSTINNQYPQLFDEFLEQQELIKNDSSYVEFYKKLKNEKGINYLSYLNNLRYLIHIVLGIIIETYNYLYKSNEFNIIELWPKKRFSKEFRIVTQKEYDLIETDITLFTIGNIIEYNSNIYEIKKKKVNKTNIWELKVRFMLFERLVDVNKMKIIDKMTNEQKEILLSNILFCDKDNAIKIYNGQYNLKSKLNQDDLDEMNSLLDIILNSKNK